MGFLFFSVPIIGLFGTSSISRKCGTNLFYPFYLPARSWHGFLFVCSDLLKYQIKHEIRVLLEIGTIEDINKS